MIAIYKHEKYKKPVLSNILISESKFDWRLSSEGLPDIDQIVIVRLCNHSKQVDEDNLHVKVLEDLKLAKYTSNGWRILPPHPLFDYSPLSHMDEIFKDTEVFHWAIPSEKDIVDWNHRFDIIGKYEKLNLEVGNKDLPLIYKALMHGGMAIATLAGPEINKPDSEFRKFYEVLYDLQNSLQYEKEEDINTNLLFTKDELPTWEELIGIISKKEYSYDPDRDTELDSYWKIPSKLMELMWLCNQLNKFAIEQNKPHRFTLMMEHHVIKIEKPNDFIIFTAKIPTTKKFSDFITNNHQRYDIAKFIPHKTDIILVDSFRKDFQHIIDDLCQDVIEYYKEPVGWKDANGNVIEVDKESRGCIPGFDPAK